MLLLSEIAASNPSWTLEQFVDTVNQLLPQFLPQATPAGRSLEEVNARLVRHYASLGILEKPDRQGKEARYQYRHLLQFLVLRRLLSEGYSTAAIGQLTAVRTNDELEALLHGGLRLTVEAANPALAFLHHVRERSQLPDRVAQAPPGPLSGSRVSGAVHPWQRVELMPGLELHIREDFVPTRSPQERQNLLDYIGRKLEEIAAKRRKSK